MGGNIHRPRSPCVFFYIHIVILLVRISITEINGTTLSEKSICTEQFSYHSNETNIKLLKTVFREQNEKKKNVDK